MHARSRRIFLLSVSKIYFYISYITYTYALAAVVLVRKYYSCVPVHGEHASVFIPRVLRGILLDFLSSVFVFQEKTAILPMRNLFTENARASLYFCCWFPQFDTR